MGPSRAQLFAGFCAVGLWATWVLPPLEAHARPEQTGEVIALWAVHMLPLASLLLAPLVGRDALYLGIFPAAMVLPIAGAMFFDWPLALATPAADLLLGGAAFVLYAVAVSLVLRRARTVAIAARSERIVGDADLADRAFGRPLGLLRGLAAGVVPLCLAYAAHFDGKVQLLVDDSFAQASGYARVFVDLAALGLGVLAADFALFAPLRDARRRGSRKELLALAEERFGVRSAPRLSFFASFGAGALLLMALAGYLAVR